MKAITTLGSLVSGILLFSSFAEASSFQCTVSELSSAGGKHTLSLDNALGKVVEKAELTGGERVSVELYFGNVQVHITGQDGNVLLSAVTPDTAPFLKVEAGKLALIECLRQ